MKLPVGYIPINHLLLPSISRKVFFFTWSNPLTPQIQLPRFHSSNMCEDKQVNHNIGKIVGANHHQFDHRRNPKKSAIQVEEAFQLSHCPPKDVTKSPPNRSLPSSVYDEVIHCPGIPCNKLRRMSLNFPHIPSNSYTAPP